MHLLSNCFIQTARCIAPMMVYVEDLCDDVKDCIKEIFETRAKTMSVFVGDSVLHLRNTRENQNNGPRMGNFT